MLAVCGAGLGAQDNNSDTEYSGIYPVLLSLSFYPSPTLFPLSSPENEREKEREQRVLRGSIAAVLRWSLLLPKKSVETPF